MARKDPNAIAETLDKSKFVMEEAPALKEAAGKLSSGVQNIQYDWGKVNSSLDALQGTADVSTARAGGKDITADYWTRRQQGEASQKPRTLADLGKIMLENAKSSAAAQAAEARAKQQAAEGETARNLNNSIYQARQRMQAQALGLSNEKFKITQTLSQTIQGMDLAQKQMLQQYYLSKSQARTAAQSINLDARQAELNNMFQYLQLGVSAAASATAATAGALNQSKPQSTTSASSNRVSQGQTSGGYSLGNSYGPRGPSALTGKVLASDSNAYAALGGS